MELDGSTAPSMPLLSFNIGILGVIISDQNYHPSIAFDIIIRSNPQVSLDISMLILQTDFGESQYGRF